MVDRFSVYNSVYKSDMLPLMLHLYRRHLKWKVETDAKGRIVAESGCKHEDKGTAFQSCQCPIWINGKLNGKPIRRSMATNSWSVAEERMELLLKHPEAVAVDGNLKRAIAAFLDRKDRRGQSPSTLKCYKQTLGHFLKWCEARSFVQLSDLNKEYLEQFMDSRTTEEGDPLQTNTQRKEFVRVRTFLIWCVDTGRAETNPSDKMKRPAARRLPTLPYDEDEVERLLAACWQIKTKLKTDTDAVRQHTYALLLTLLYSGLRMSDAIRLRRSQLDPRTGSMHLRTLKTDEDVYCQLPPIVLAELAALPRVSETYFFWDEKHVKANSLHWTFAERLHQAGAIAKVDNPIPHRCRDTFACTLVANDTAMRTVQHLLGHSSIETTERNYTPFLPSHQRLLNTAVAGLEFGQKASRPRLVNAH